MEMTQASGGYFDGYCRMLQSMSYSLLLAICLYGNGRDAGAILLLIASVHLGKIETNSRISRENVCMLLKIRL